MLRIVFLLFALYYSLQAAENTLLNRQLEAINRQLNAERAASGQIDPNADEAYNYNQNTVLVQEDRRSERMYVGANGFLGYFQTTSDDQAYDVRESTSFTYFKLGYIFRSGYRAEATLIYEAGLNYTDFEDRFSGVSVNAILPMALNVEKTVYLKLQGGVGIYDYSSFGLEGISLNPAAGVIIDITRDIELDISYLYKFILWEDFGNLSSSSQIKSTSFRGVAIGFKYKF